MIESFLLSKISVINRVAEIAIQALSEIKAFVYF